MWTVVAIIQRIFLPLMSRRSGGKVAGIGIDRFQSSNAGLAEFLGSRFPETDRVELEAGPV